MDMLLTLSSCLSDPVKLDQILPYLVSLLADKSSLVRSHCLATIATLMASVKEISSINVTLYPEYLWPHLRPLLTDSEVMVRSSFAKHLIKFAESAYSFLDMSQVSPYLTHYLFY
jgi:phosphoinositide-3-kinase regulatory subunit 4